jgi:hypothetical protein
MKYGLVQYMAVPIAAFVLAKANFSMSPCNLLGFVVVLHV